MDVKDNRERAATQINRLATSNTVSINSDRDNSVKVTRNNKARNGVLSDKKQQGKKTPKHHISQSY